MYKLGQRVIVKTRDYNGKLKQKRGFVTGICDGEEEVLYSVFVLERHCTYTSYYSNEQIIADNWKLPMYNIGQKVIVNLDDDTGKHKEVKGIVCEVDLEFTPKEDFEYKVLLFDGDPYAPWIAEKCLTPYEWEEV